MQNNPPKTESATLNERAGTTARHAQPQPLKQHQRGCDGYRRHRCRSVHAQNLFNLALTIRCI